MAVRNSLSSPWLGRLCRHGLPALCGSLLLLPSLGLPAAMARGGSGGGFHGGGGGFHGGGRAGGYHNGRAGDHPMYGGGTRGNFDNNRVNVNVHNNFYNCGYGGWHEG